MHRTRKSEIDQKTKIDFIIIIIIIRLTSPLVLCTSPARRNARSGWIRRPCRMARAGVSDRKQKSTSQITSCRSQTPSKSPPAPPRIPPGRPKSTVHLILWLFISLGTRRARCKKTIPHGPWCEFASKVQAARCLFHDFYALTHFSHHMFSKKCFSLLWGAHFWKRLRALSVNKITFFKKCDAKSELEHKDHERGNLKLALLMQSRITIRRWRAICISLGECRAKWKAQKSARGSFWGGRAECAGALGGD